MEQGAGDGQDATWDFQQKYLSCLVAMLRHAKFERTTTASARSRTVKFAADLSLAMTSKDRTAWSRAMFAKYLIRREKSRCQLRRFKSRGIFRAVRRSASAKSRPCKTNVVFKKFARQLIRPASITGLNCEKEARDTVASRMQTLMMLVPGSLGLDTPVFLQEAADYIVALKMQVWAMQALANLYSNSGVHDPREV